ncbi:hypothetical protein [Dactylosporangium sp. NPDC051541]|uniref:hypothetical protein n=1 Tax=Dactylosporangium sp. NPDC051541 TaxID=3363977 RepID=UPI0037A55070
MARLANPSRIAFHGAESVLDPSLGTLLSIGDRPILSDSQAPDWRGVMSADLLNQLANSGVKKGCQKDAE